MCFWFRFSFHQQSVYAFWSFPPENEFYGFFFIYEHKEVKWWRSRERGWSTKLISLVFLFIHTYKNNKQRVNGAAMVPLISKKEKNVKNLLKTHTQAYINISFIIFPFRFTGDWVEFFSGGEFSFFGCHMCTIFYTFFFSFSGWRSFPSFRFLVYV